MFFLSKNKTWSCIVHVLALSQNKIGVWWRWFLVIEDLVAEMQSAETSFCRLRQVCCFYPWHSYIRGSGTSLYFNRLLMKAHRYRCQCSQDKTYNQRLPKKTHFILKRCSSEASYTIDVL